MDNEKIIENPERGTAGLTSSIQVVDTTNSVTIGANDSSSEISGAFPFLIFPPKEAKSTVVEPLSVRRQSFKESLERSIDKNKDLLRKLAQY